MVHVCSDIYQKSRQDATEEGKVSPEIFVEVAASPNLTVSLCFYFPGFSFPCWEYSQDSKWQNVLLKWWDLSSKGRHYVARCKFSFSSAFHIPSGGWDNQHCYCYINLINTFHRWKWGHSSVNVKAPFFHLECLLEPTLLRNISRTSFPSVVHIYAPASEAGLLLNWW